jgi:ubiquinone/menaquinone biosynthesis C-methylase UbiE
MLRKNITTLLIVLLIFHGLKGADKQVDQNFIKEIWNDRAQEWSNYIGGYGKNDPNRAFQSDPVLWHMLKNVENITVLDVGCGEGYLSRILSSKGAKVITIDSSNKLIDIAKQKAKIESLDIDYRIEDCAHIKSIASESIDKIICNYVLMDLPDLEGAIHEFNRVLKPSGEAVVIFSHPCFPMETIQKNPDLAIVYGWKQPYFKEHVMKLPQWDGFSDGFTIFHRPLSTYWKIFKKAGFEIIEFDEPYVSEEIRKQIDPKFVEKFTSMPHSVAFLLCKI